MSPHGIAGPQNQTLPNLGKKCPLARPLTMQNFVHGDPTRSVRDIRDQKFVLPEKVDQNSPKSLKTCHPLNPSIMPNFIEIGETTSEKSVTIFVHPSIFWLSRTKGHLSGWWVTSTPTPLATCKISSRSDDPSPIYLLPNFVDFVAGVTHKTTKNRKRYVTALHAATRPNHETNTYPTYVHNSFFCPRWHVSEIRIGLDWK